MSLFGQSSGTPAGGPFSNLNAAASTEQPPKRRTSIFAPSGETAQAAATSNSLFGNTPSSTSTPSSSIFSTLTTMSAPSGGLFSGIGASQSTSQPSGSGLFSGLGQNTTSSTQPSGLFASSGLFPPK